MAAESHADELRTLINQARIISDHVAAFEEQSRRTHLFWDRFADGDVSPPFPWDHWQMWAVEDGVSKSLATLGAVWMWAAHEYDWPEALQTECGWRDCGREMIALAQQDPEQASLRWRYLLDSGGDFCNRV